jgi:hypothetical protein
VFCRAGLEDRIHGNLNLSATLYRANDWALVAVIQLVVEERRLNSAGTVVDFGAVQADGMVWLQQTGQSPLALQLMSKRRINSIVKSICRLATS